MSNHNIGDLVYYEMYGLGMIAEIRYEEWKKGYDYRIEFFSSKYCGIKWYDAGFIPDMKGMVDYYYVRS